MSGLEVLRDRIAQGGYGTYQDGQLMITGDIELLKQLTTIDRNTSDGYHTFDELYDHRMALTLALMSLYAEVSWKSKRHHPDGEPMFDGFFIAGMNLPVGVISYHYKLEHWPKFRYVKTVEYAPEWDGHTPNDVVKRLVQFAAYIKEMNKA